jgi:hypothetical protein
MRISGCPSIDINSRWSQPLAVAIRTFDFIKRLREFATLGPAYQNALKRLDR